MSIGLLYHYTCDHQAPSIAQDGVLKPGIDGLVWLTDLDAPPRLALGLTSYTLSCDRMANRFTVTQSADTVWWMRYRKLRPDLVAKELCDGVMPMHWWVSERPVSLVRVGVSA